LLPLFLLEEELLFRLITCRTGADARDRKQCVWCENDRTN